MPWWRVRELALHYETMLAAKQPAAGGAGAIAGGKRKAPAESTPVSLLKRAGRFRRMEKVFACARTMTALLGGKSSFTSFVIDIVARAVVKSHKGWGRHEVVDADVISRLLDDPEMRVAVEKELLRTRKARVSHFRFARVKAGLTLAGMDALRFAMPWCPGHATLAKDKAQYLQHIFATYCPCSDIICGTTARTVAQQAADAAREAEEERDHDEHEEEAVLEEARAAAAAPSDPADGGDEPASDATVGEAWAEVQTQDEHGDAGGEESLPTPEDWAGRAKATQQWGSRSVVDALTMMLIATWFGNVVLPGSSSQRFGFKITCAAAHLRNAPKLYKHATTVMVQVLCAGVTAGSWGAAAVRHMVRLPQSACRAFKLRCWYGKDDRVSVRCPPARAHMTTILGLSLSLSLIDPPHTLQLEKGMLPYITEGLALEREGMRTHLLMSMPPWWVERHGGWSPTTTFEMKELPLSTLPGTARNKHAACPREHVVENVQLWPSLLVACDGASTFALTGVSVGSSHPDMFTDTSKVEMGKLLRISPLAKGQSYADLAEKLLPGCTGDKSRDHWFYEMLVWSNRHSANAELQATTREPLREAAKEWKIGKAVSKVVKKKLKGARLPSAGNSLRDDDTLRLVNLMTF